MECERVPEEFVERLTGTLDPDRARLMDQHLAGCAACRAETGRMRELWTELGSLRMPAAGGAAGRIGRLIDARARGASVSDPAVSSRGELVPRIAIGTLALAASLLVGMVVGRRSTSAPPERGVTLGPVAAATTPKERYVLLLHGPARSAPTGAARSAADVAAEGAIVEEYRAWANRLRQAGSLVLAEKLADDPRTMLVANRSIDMPRNTADELGGFFLIQAADSAEAFRIARECPHLKYGGTVQVRRIEPT